MPGVSDSEIGRIAEQIERYLQDHPHAADTAEGIGAWWLPAYGIEASPQAVQTALDWLCANSVLDCRAQAGGQPLYWRYRSPKAQDD